MSVIWDYFGQGCSTIFPTLVCVCEVASACGTLKASTVRLFGTVEMEPLSNWIRKALRATQLINAMGYSWSCTVYCCQVFLLLQYTDSYITNGVRAPARLCVVAVGKSKSCDVITNPWYYISKSSSDADPLTIQGCRWSHKHACLDNHLQDKFQLSSSKKLKKKKKRVVENRSLDVYALRRFRQLRRKKKGTSKCPDSLAFSTEQNNCCWDTVLTNSNYTQLPIHFFLKNVVFISLFRLGQKWSSACGVSQILSASSRAR